jgi:hypothetical protein
VTTKLYIPCNEDAFLYHVDAERESRTLALCS